MWLCWIFKGLLTADGYFCAHKWNRALILLGLPTHNWSPLLSSSGDTPALLDASESKDSRDENCTQYSRYKPADAYWHFLVSCIVLSNAIWFLSSSIWELFSCFHININFVVIIAGSWEVMNSPEPIILYKNLGLHVPVTLLSIIHSLALYVHYVLCLNQLCCTWEKSTTVSNAQLIFSRIYSLKTLLLMKQYKMNSNINYATSYCWEENTVKNS